MTHETQIIIKLALAALFGAKPKSVARRTSAAKRAERMNVFDGTQPVNRQSPPSAVFSINSTRAPSCAAPTPATNPPDPPPITIKSYLSITFASVSFGGLYDF